MHGFEIEKGKWKIFTEQELSKLKVKNADEIAILGFSTIDRFDPILFAKNYFVVPSKEKEKSYFLLKEVLRATAKVAYGKIVLHEKEHVAIMRPYKLGMLLTILHYPHEIRDINELAELKEKVSISKERIRIS